MFGTKPKVPDETPSTDANTEAVKQLVEALPGMIQQAVQTANQGIIQQMQESSTSQQQQQQHATPPTAPKDPLEGVDFDNLENKDMFQLLTQVLDQKLEGFQNTLTPQLEDLGMRVQRKELRDDLDKVRDREGELFSLYKEDMRALASRYPNLAPEDLFDLARTKNPAPAQEHEKKIAAEEAEKRAGEETPFGGLLPTSGKAAQVTEGMKFTDASEQAWEKVMANVPSEVIGGGNH